MRTVVSHHSLACLNHGASCHLVVARHRYPSLTSSGALSDRRHLRQRLRQALSSMRTRQVMALRHRHRNRTGQHAYLGKVQRLLQRPSLIVTVVPTSRIIGRLYSAHTAKHVRTHLLRQPAAQAIRERLRLRSRFVNLQGSKEGRDLAVSRHRRSSLLTLCSRTRTEHNSLRRSRLSQGNRKTTPITRTTPRYLIPSRRFMPVIQAETIT